MRQNVLRETANKKTERKRKKDLVIAVSEGLQRDLMVTIHAISEGDNTIFESKMFYLTFPICKSTCTLRHY